VPPIARPPSRQPTRLLLSALALLAARPAAGVQASAPAAGERRRAPASRVRATLRACTAEGVFAELVTACAGPTVLMGWALHLGARPLEVALVGALPQLAQLVQLPAAWMTALIGRRRAALWAVGLSRQAILPLALVPLLSPSPAGARALLLAVAAVGAALGVAGNNAWTAWMGEVVPEGLRGRYFGRRVALTTVGGTLGGLAVARLLDVAAGHGAAGAALAALALAASLLGAVTTALMARQHEPAAARGPAPRLADAVRPLRDPAARGLLVYQLAWNASVGLAGAWFTFHLLANLQVGYTVVALHAAAGAAARVCSAPLWGRAIDRFGARPVLAACSFAAGVLPLLWLAAAPGRLWPIALDALIGGVAWGGHGLAAFAVPLAVAPRRERPFYLAAFAMAGGAAYALGAAGGAMVASPGAGVRGIGALFAASAAVRLASAFLALRIDERGAGSLRELHDAARGAARGALSAMIVRAPVPPGSTAPRPPRRSRAA
jgi:MFS family permease